MHTLVSMLVAFIDEKYYMALTEIQLKYVGFMAPLAKTVPGPCSSRSLRITTCSHWQLTAYTLQQILLSGIWCQRFE